MKTLGKLNINPEKVMKNEELIALRGGYGGISCCNCFNRNTYEIVGYIYFVGEEECNNACIMAWNDTLGVWECHY